MRTLNWLDCLCGHEDWVRTLNWTEDGQFLRSEDLWAVIFWHVATGRRLTEEESVRLVVAFPFSSGNVRYSAIAGKGETVFLQVGSETPLARVPLRLDWTSADGLNWAGGSGSEVYLLRLEGVAKNWSRAPS